MESYVIIINEIDDVDDALDELQEELKRLGLPGKLKKNTLGIVTARDESVVSGVCKAVCDALPFPTAGLACESQGATGNIGMYLLSVMVLTSDDCTFAVGNTADISGAADVAPPVTECYSALSQKLCGTPKLCLLYTPYSLERFPGGYIDAITDTAPGVPVFGGVSVGADDLTNGTFNSVYTICNGESFGNSVVMVLVSGDISPKFLVSTFAEDSVKIRDMGTVTKCNKNVIMEINNMPAVKYLKQVGFFWADIAETNSTKASAGVVSATLIFNYGDEASVSRSIGSMTDDNEIVCLGNVKEGSKITLVVATPEIIVESTNAVIKDLQESGSKTILLYSCIGRRIGLLGNPMAEFELMRDAFGKSGVNYIAGHVGGEISPVLTDGRQKLLNCEHNHTLIACIL
jgi:hypothetical protein